MFKGIEKAYDAAKYFDNSNKDQSLRDNSKERSNDEFNMYPNERGITSSRNFNVELEQNDLSTHSKVLVKNDTFSPKNKYWRLFTLFLQIYKALQHAFKCIGMLSQLFSWFRSSQKTDKVHLNFESNNASEGGSFTLSQSLNHQELTENPTIKTLEDSIRHFDLTAQLRKLDLSLEAARKKEISKKDHEDCFKDIDRKIQKLSIQHHPDKVKNRGGTEREIETAQNLQTALNALRTALKFLNSAFMDDIDTDHHFGFYTNLSIRSVCNEDGMKKHIFAVILKIDMISQTKQQYIISEIRKFLIKSEGCIRSYLAREFKDFETNRDEALDHLKYCINGFEKLSIEIQKVKEQCKSEENGENMFHVLNSMARKGGKDLKLLQSLERTAEMSLRRKCQLFRPKEDMDSYFVFPLVSYTNVILMCNVMMKSSAVSYKRFLDTESHPQFSNEISDFMNYFDYLVSYCSDKKSHARTVLEMMNIETQQELKKEEIELEFNKRLKNVSESLKDKFHVDDYPEGSMSSRDLKKCLELMTEFHEKEKEVTKAFKEFQKKAEEMNDEHEKFLKKMEEAEEMSQKVQERLEQSKKFNDMVADFLSKQQ